MARSVCVVYYSRTGNTRTVASDLAADLDAPATRRIVPRTPRSYPNWLARSFRPGSRVAIRPVQTDLREYDAVFLGTPKWTFSCPPINEFLARATLDGVTVGPFVTFGGFDEARYTGRLAERLGRLGASVPATLRIQRDSIGGRTYDGALTRFRERVLADARADSG